MRTVRTRESRVTLSDPVTASAAPPWRTVARPSHRVSRALVWPAFYYPEKRYTYLCNNVVSVQIVLPPFYLVTRCTIAVPASLSPSGRPKRPGQWQRHCSFFLFFGILFFTLDRADVPPKNVLHHRLSPGSGPEEDSANVCHSLRHLQSAPSAVLVCFSCWQRRQRSYECRAPINGALYSAALSEDARDRTISCILPATGAIGRPRRSYHLLNLPIRPSCGHAQRRRMCVRAWPQEMRHENCHDRARLVLMGSEGRDDARIVAYLYEHLL